MYILGILGVLVVVWVRGVLGGKGVEDKTLRVSSWEGTGGTKGTREGTLGTRGTRWKGLANSSLRCRKGKGRSSSVKSLLLDYQPCWVPSATATISSPQRYFVPKLLDKVQEDFTKWPKTKYLSRPNVYYPFDSVEMFYLWVTNASFGTTWCKLHKRFSNTRDNCILSIHLLAIIWVVIISIQIDEIGNWFLPEIEIIEKKWKDFATSSASEYNTSARDAACCNWELLKWKSDKHLRREMQEWW